MKKIVKFFSAVLLIFAIGVSPVLAANYKPDKTVYSNIALLMNLDDENKTVVYEKNADLKSAPASLTKIATVGVILEQVKDLDNTMVTVSEHAIAAVQGTNSSVAGLKVGEEMNMHQLLYRILMQSANEACIVAAEHIAGSEEKFVAMMNEYVQKLGCKNTRFANVHGLDQDGHYTTARDLAVIIQNVLKYPEFMTICNHESYDIPATNKNPAKTITTTNMLINHYRTEYYYRYANGIKTGTTSKAGNCLVSTATKDGYTYLCIIMQGKIVPADDGNKYSVQTNFYDSRRLYEWAFSNFKFKTVAKSQTIAGTVPVNNAKDVDDVQLVPQQDVSALVPSNLEESGVLIEIDQEKTPKTLDAPVKKGDVIGEAKVIYGGQEIARVKLVAAQDVKRSVVLFVVNTAKKLLSTVWAKLILALLGVLVAAYILVVILYNRKKRRNRIRVVKNYRDL